MEELMEVVDHPTFPTIQEEAEKNGEEGISEMSDLGKRRKELKTRLGKQGFSGGDEVFASFTDMKQWAVVEGIESSGIF